MSGGTGGEFNYALLTEVSQHGWKVGLSKCLDSLSGRESEVLIKLLRSRIANTKLFVDLAQENILVIDAGLGIAADAFADNCENVVLLDFDLDKLHLVDARNYFNENVRVVLGTDYKNLPFKTGTFGAVYIVSKALDKNGYNKANFYSLYFEELFRITSSKGRLLFIYKCDKWDWLWGKYQKFIKRAGWGSTDTFLVNGNIEGSCEVVNATSFYRLTSIESSFSGKVCSFVRRNLFNPLLATNRIIVARKNETISSNTLSKIVFVLEKLTDRPLRLEKLLIQSSTIIFLADTTVGSMGFVVRVPYDEASHKRCLANFKALDYWFSINNNIKLQAPVPVYSGTIDQVPFFVESRLSGYSFDDKNKDYDLIVDRCLNISISLYKATKYCINKKKQNFVEFLDSLFLPLRSSTYIQGRSGDLADLYNFLIESCLSPGVSGCICHGDFKAENVLFDKDLFPVGIIDCDLFIRYGFPYLDLFHLLCRRRAIYCGSTVIEFIDKVLLAWHVDDFERKRLQKYMQETGSEPDHLFIGVILYWLHHISHRMGFHQAKEHEKWFSQFVLRQLDIVKSYLSSTPPKFDI